MPTKATFLQDGGIYGKIERSGWKTCETSSFVVFKDNDQKWTIAQERSGLLVASLLPRHWHRTKKDLLAFVAEMEAAEPEACAKMGEVTGFPMRGDLRPYGTRLVEWAAARK